jgi:hypothetical protein
MEPHEIAAKETECVARALAIAFHGDDVEWVGFLSKAVAFQEALKKARYNESLLDLHRSRINQ